MSKKMTQQHVEPVSTPSAHHRASLEDATSVKGMPSSTRGFPRWLEIALGTINQLLTFVTRLAYLWVAVTALQQTGNLIFVTLLLELSREQPRVVEVLQFLQIGMGNVVQSIRAKTIASESNSNNVPIEK